MLCTDAKPSREMRKLADCIGEATMELSLSRCQLVAIVGHGHTARAPRAGVVRITA